MTTEIKNGISVKGILNKEYTNMIHTVYDTGVFEDSCIACPVCGRMALYMTETDTYECTDCDYESECVSDNPDNFEEEI